MYFRRWITGLDRSQFEIFAYHLHPGVDALGSEIAASVDHFRHLVGPRWRVANVAAAIRDDALDVLVYLELGMHSVSFALAALRLAPVQCAAWGHPTTTGHPTIDYYLSAAAMEPPDAAAHYSERLVLLPGIGTQYSPPAIPEDTDRARFSLPQDKVLLLCPQSLFKVHPDNDDLLAAVLAAAREYDARALRGPSPGADRPLHAAARAGVRRARHRDPRARDRVAEPLASRLPARQPRLRRDGRYAALVRRQHEPRRARLRAAHRHAARRADARPADGGDARGDRRDRADRRESRRLRADRREARHGRRVAQRTARADRATAGTGCSTIALRSIACRRSFRRSRLPTCARSRPRPRSSASSNPRV